MFGPVANYSGAAPTRRRRARGHGSGTTGLGKDLVSSRARTNRSEMESRRTAVCWFCRWRLSGSVANLDLHLDEGGRAATPQPGPGGSQGRGTAEQQRS